MSTEQQKLIIKIHLYRITAILLGVVGLLIFVMLYSQIAAADFLYVLHNPMTVLWLILPFTPSSFFFWLTGRVEKKLMVLLEQKKKSS